MDGTPIVLAVLTSLRKALGWARMKEDCVAGTVEVMMGLELIAIGVGYAETYLASSLGEKEKFDFLASAMLSVMTYAVADEQTKLCIMIE